MNVLPQYLTLDTNDDLTPSVVAVKGEIGVRDLDISLVQNGIPVNLTSGRPYIYAVTPSGANIFKEARIKSALDGLVTVNVPQDITSEPGLTKACITVNEGSKMLVSFNFFINVGQAAYDEDAIIASNDFSALTDAVGRVNSFQSQLDNIANKGTTVEVLERVTKEEIDRQVADGTIANLLIEDNSITQDKLKIDEGKITGAYTPNNILEVPQEEFIGDGQFGNSIIGYKKTMKKTVVFNKIELMYYMPNVDKGSEVRIYIRDTNAMFTPVNETPVFTKTLTKDEVSHSADVSTILNLDEPLQVLNGKCIFILFVGGNIRTWDVQNSDRTRETCVYIWQNSSWDNLLSTHTAYIQTDFRLYYKIDGWQIKDNTIEGYKLKDKSIDDSKFVNAKVAMSDDREILDCKIKNVALTTKYTNDEFLGSDVSPRTACGIMKTLQNDVMFNKIILPIIPEQLLSYDLEIRLLDVRPSYDVTGGTILLKKTFGNGECVIDNLTKNLVINLPTTLYAKKGKTLTISIKAKNGFTVIKIFRTGNDERDYIIAGNTFESLFVYKDFYSAMTKLMYVPLENVKITNLNDIRISIPSYINTVVDDTFELFYSGVINVNDIEQYNIDVVTYALDGSNLNRGNRYKNRWIYTPQASHTDFKLRIRVYTMSNVLLNECVTTIKVNAKKTSNSTVKNILCIGDSTTAGGEWVSELNRRLTGTGGIPVGLGLQNINFVGSKGTGVNKYEATPGWSTVNYLSSASPFYDNTTASKINFKKYCTGLGVNSLDIACILLGWNQIKTKTFTKDNHLNTKTDLNIIISQLKADFPNIKIILISPQMPSRDGLGASYGANDAMWNYNWSCQSVMGMSECYEEICNNNSNMSYINLSCQFDNANNYPMAERNVNVRNNKKETYSTNGIHPSYDGYMQFADAIYRGIMPLI